MSQRPLPLWLLPLLAGAPQNWFEDAGQFSDQINLIRHPAPYLYTFHGFNMATTFAAASAHTSNHYASPPTETSFTVPSASSLNRLPSHSRALIIQPTGLSTPSPPATASPQAEGYAASSPNGGGLTSKAWEVKARPKPGRKPATDQPQSKRKQQNRESQRKFRAAKVQREVGLQTELAKEKEGRARDVADRDQRLAQLAIQSASEAADLRRRILEVEDELHLWKTQCGALHQELEQYKTAASNERAQSMAALDRQNTNSMDVMDAHMSDPPNLGGCGNCGDDGNCPCVDDLVKDPVPTSTGSSALPQSTAAQGFITPANTSSDNSPPGHDHSDPPTDYAHEHETDYTHMFRGLQSNRTPRNVPSNTPKSDDKLSVSFMTSSDQVQVQCGFCTDSTNCYCKQSLPLPPQPTSSANDTVPLIRKRKSQPSSSTRTTTGPGSCADCMANPKQKAWCEAVSRLKTPGSTDVLWARDGNNTMAPIRSKNPQALPKPVMSTLEPSNHSSVGCDEAFRLFDGRLPMDRDHMDWVNSLRPVSPSGRKAAGADRKYSAVELESASVIASLTHTMGPLLPRPRDGPNADLVVIAEERRGRVSNSSTPLTPGHEH